MRDALRPTSLDEFVGQHQAVEHLRIVLGGARSRGELCDHVLLSGPPGVGKTTLAQIVAGELGATLVTSSGPAIERPGDIAALLSSLNGPTVVFIDEIHRLPKVAEELLYPAMEDGVLDLLVGEGPRARSVRLPLPPWCLVGATTQAGLLSAPMRDRFGFQVRLSLYDEDDLAGVVTRAAGLLGLDLADGAAREISRRGRGTPRVANALLRRVRDWADYQGLDAIDEAAAVAGLETFGIDEVGLDQLGREILSVLCRHFGGGPVGLGTLAAAVGEAAETISAVHEPHLMRCGLLARTPRGRVVTPAGYAHLGLVIPDRAWAAALDSGTGAGGEEEAGSAENQGTLPLETPLTG
jgi:Holliday junction DNA helicase RuvB